MEGPIDNERELTRRARDTLRAINALIDSVEAAATNPTTPGRLRNRDYRQAVVDFANATKFLKLKAEAAALDGCLRQPTAYSKRAPLFNAADAAAELTSTQQ